LPRVSAHWQPRACAQWPTWKGKKEFRHGTCRKPFSTACSIARNGSSDDFHSLFDFRGQLYQNPGPNGRLWQGRYYSAVLDDEHFWAALWYVEFNSVRAGIVLWAE
jgi:hypothetical protein